MRGKGVRLGEGTKYQPPTGRGGQTERGNPLVSASRGTAPPVLRSPGAKVAWGRGPQVRATHPGGKSTSIGERGRGGVRPRDRKAGQS